MLRLHRILGLVSVLCFVLPAAMFAQGLPENPQQPPKNLGTVSGRVTLDHGKPAAGFTVFATPFWYPRMRPFEGNPNTAVTDKDGRYSITLRPANFNFSSGPIIGPLRKNAPDFFIVVSNGGQPYIEPKAQQVDASALPNHTAADINFVLHLGPQIIVQIHDAITGAPTPGVSIRYGDAVGVGPSAGVTGTDGTLRFRLPYTDIRLEGDVPDDQRGTLEFAPGYGNGNQVYKEVAGEPGKDFVWPLKTYGTMQKSDWHGVILDAQEHPAAGVPVTLLGTGYDGNVPLLTDAQGRFSVMLPRIRDDQVGNGPDYHPPVIFAKQGTMIVAHLITSDESWNGMTLRLAPGGSFSGTLTDLKGDPASGAGVSLAGHILNDLWVQPWQPNSGSSAGEAILPKTVTDSHGHFTLTGVPAGSYQIQAHGGGYGNLIVPAAVSAYSNQQPQIDLAQGQHRDMGTVTIPRADKVLTGTVVDTQGRPATSLWITVKGLHTNQVASTQQDGTFRVDDLVDEPLTVTVGQADHVITTTVAPGQSTLRVVAQPDVVASNGRGVPSEPVNRPTGTTAVLPAYKSIPFDGLVLQIDPDYQGKFTASIVRPNSVDTTGWSGPLMLPPGAPGLLAVWHGTLADLDGLHLAVKNDHGILTSHKGDVLWSGVVIDPPDYAITSDARHPKAPRLTVQDSHGKTLWSGLADPNSLWQLTSLVSNGNMKIMAPQNKIAWERGIGDARVALVGTRPDGNAFSDWRPLDGTVTLHFETLTGTLRASDGHVLWSGPAPSVTATTANFTLSPPNPHDPNWWMPEFRMRNLLPPSVVPLMDVQNVPDRAVLSYIDAQGQDLPSATSTYYVRP